MPFSLAPAKETISSLAGMPGIAGERERRAAIGRYDQPGARAGVNRRPVPERAGDQQVMVV